MSITGGQDHFHEIRGLAITALFNAGHGIEAVKGLAAHTNSKVTEGYMAEGDRAWTDVDVTQAEDLFERKERLKEISIGL